MNTQIIKGRNAKILLTAGLVLLMLSIAAIGALTKLSTTSFILDVNPSIEIKTNGLKRVVEVKALNQDAQRLLKNFKMKDNDIEDVVENLIDLMILNGYITGGDDNMVMITVKDESADKELVEKINRAIAAYLENRQLEAAVVSQTVDMDDDDIKVAKEKGISPGKLNIIKRLLSRDSSLTYEEMESVSLKDLVLALEERDMDLDDLFDDYIEISKVSDDDYFEKDDDRDDHKDDKEAPQSKIEVKTVEKASDKTATAKKAKTNNTANNEKSNRKEIISADKAKSIALGLANGTITDFELDEDHGRLKYEIEIKANGIEHEIKIDAYTGKILKHEKDRDDDWDDDDYKKYGNKSNIISAEKAKSIALGLANGKITDFELDEDDGILIYKVEIKAKGLEHEIEIDAHTGKVLEHEIDD